MKNTISSLILGVAIVIATVLLANAWKKSHQGHNSINVTGLASRNFASDLIVWSGSFQRKEMTTKDAFAELKNDMATIKQYLLSKGVSEKEIVFSAVNINKEFQKICC